MVFQPDSLVWFLVWTNGYTFQIHFWAWALLQPMTGVESRVVPQLGHIRQITPKYKKLKFIDMDMCWVQKWHLFCAQITPSLSFGLISVHVSSIWQVVVGWIFGNIRPCFWVVASELAHDGLNLQSVYFLTVHSLFFYAYSWSCHAFKSCPF